MVKLKQLVIQMIKFGGVGALCFVIDYGIMVLLKECFGFHELLAAGISFCVSVVVNYILSVRFVFNANAEHSKARDFVLFIIFSVIGLGLTELIMWIGASLLLWNYQLVKIFATAIVMVFNFITRKMFLE